VANLAQYLEKAGELAEIVGRDEWKALSEDWKPLEEDIQRVWNLQIHLGLNMDELTGVIPFQIYAGMLSILRDYFAGEVGA